MTNFLVTSSIAEENARTLLDFTWVEELRSNLQAADGELISCWIARMVGRAIFLCDAPDAMTSALAIQQTPIGRYLVDLMTLEVQRIDS
jgi:hypothetical protein